jgi:hypothetical protein
MSCRSRLALPLVLLAALLLPGASLAGQPKNYAYYFLQGKIADSLGTKRLEGATVRLAAGTDVFEATTDERGTFMFERLPVQSYDLTVTSADGEVIRYIEKVDLGDPDRMRLKIRMGTGEARKARIDAGTVTEVAVEPTDRTPHWRKFWKQLAVFAGAAAALAI